MLPAFGIAIFAWTPGPWELLIGFGALAIVALVVIVIAVAVTMRREQRDSRANPNLVPCPDCGRVISLAANACPGCGRPTTATPSA